MIQRTTTDMMPRIKTDPNAWANPTGEQSRYAADGGLTKRELFAAMALQGVMADEDTMGVIAPKQIAKIVLEHVDALIEELNRG